MNPVERLDSEPLRIPADSRLFGTNSLLSITENLSLLLRKGWGISGLIRSEESEFGEIPCIFPVCQGWGQRDEFAPDSPHRH
jgi:hypothetical protein